MDISTYRILCFTDLNDYVATTFRIGKNEEISNLSFKDILCRYLWNKYLCMTLLPRARARVCVCNYQNTVNVSKVPNLVVELNQPMALHPCTPTLYIQVSMLLYVSFFSYQCIFISAYLHILLLLVLPNARTGRSRRFQSKSSTR